MAEMLYTGAEKRRYKRTTKPVGAMIQIPSATVLMNWETVSVHDTGAGGMYFLHNEELMVGSLLNFKISLSPESRTIRCIGKVLRAKKVGNTDTFGIAVCFVDIDPSDMNLINIFAD